MVGNVEGAEVASRSVWGLCMNCEIVLRRRRRVVVACMLSKQRIMCRTIGCLYDMRMICCRGFKGVSYMCCACMSEALQR